MRISFLHTIPANEAVFQNAAILAHWAPEHLRHTIRPDLRQTMEQHSPPGKDAQQLVQQTIMDLAADADAVIVTCATLGPVVDAMPPTTVRIIRADAALAEAASRAGKNITVLCAVESTIEPNRALFERHAARTGARVTVQLLPDVWPLFVNGDLDACLEACARAAENAYRDGADVVAFAHPWMGPASERVQGDARPLHAAQAALSAVSAKA
ncbi:hypothetical protein CAL26_10630 [Bordetella genomosp. 9]|uniref:Arylsulfatase n=2 Tax=Bordetella genomosp. 9 TaxID=1416803 RepID=A0A261RFZ1_9BORD|nr:hypothetical protein CAL26_10630 [Bordetella genomosp. 9]